MHSCMERAAGLLKPRLRGHIRTTIYAINSATASKLTSHLSSPTAPPLPSWVLAELSSSKLEGRFGVFDRVPGDEAGARVCGRIVI